jgi:hypothetical protein
MTGRQKVLTGIGLLALILTLLSAPYKYVGTVGAETVSGATRWPIWKEPTYIEGTPAGPVLVERAELDRSRLGTWWAGIALVTVAFVALAAPRRS